MIITTSIQRTNGSKEDLEIIYNLIEINGTPHDLLYTDIQLFILNRQNWTFNIFCKSSFDVNREDGNTVAQTV